MHLSGITGEEFEQEYASRKSLNDPRRVSDDFICSSQQRCLLAFDTRQVRQGQKEKRTNKVIRPIRQKSQLFYTSSPS